MLLFSFFQQYLVLFSALLKNTVSDDTLRRLYLKLTILCQGQKDCTFCSHHIQRLLLVWRLSVGIKWRACLRNYGTCRPEIWTDNFRGHSAVLVKQVNSWSHLRSPRLRPTDDLLSAPAALLFQKIVSKYNICLKSGLVEVQSLGPTSWKKRISVNC